MATPQSEILEYVGAHWWMYRCARHLLITRFPDRLAYNAAAYVSLVHARALTHFFYMAGRKHRTDWTADDLGLARQSMPAELHNRE